MAVYVDNMHEAPLGEFGRMKMSHMIADTEAELHAMAAAIGIARRWYQGDHYDVAKSKRAAAIKLGARAITMRELAAMNGLRRMRLEMGDPRTAPDRYREARAARKAAEGKEQ